KDLARRLPRRLPAREARGARAGPSQGLRAAAADLGRDDARARRDERHGLRDPLLRNLHRDALHRDGAVLVRRRRRRPLPPRRLVRREQGQPHPGACHGLAASLDGAQGLLPADRRLRAAPGLPGLPDRQVALLDRERRLARLGPRQGDVHDDVGHAAHPPRRQRLPLLGARARARADRRVGAAARLHALRRTGDEGGDPGRRRLLEAARGRPHVRLRAADVHHRRRRPPADPTDGYHAAVRLLRRLVRRRELPCPRRPAPGLEPGDLAAVTRQISRVAIFTLVMLAALVVATTYWQTWASSGLAARQDNEIQRVAQFEIKRGLILAADGHTVLATNVRRKRGGQTLY